MTTDEILLLALGLVTFFIWLARIMQRKLQIDSALKDIIAKHVHEIKVEMHGDDILWFDKETDQFYAQGKTIQECVDKLKQGWANDVFIYTTVSEKQFLLAGPDFEPCPLSADTPPEGML